MSTGTVIQVPYAPRPLQREVAKRLRGTRHLVLVCHRRWGKTILAVNMLQQGALMCQKVRPRFAYIAPTYRQGKAVAWDAMRHYAQDIPGVEINHSELRIDFPEGGQVRIYGADNPDSLRGLYLDGAVLDEYGMHPAKTYTEVIAPALVDRKGWVMFCGTPNGANQFFDMAQHAMREQETQPQEWAYCEYRASQTGLLDADTLAQARAVMTQDEFDQEFECSWTASVRGAIYAKELQAARDEGRITRVPIDAALPVETDWDLGIGDATAIWFSQRLRTGEVRYVDYYEASGEALPHYVQVLQKKPYTYGQHWAPHDIRVRELGTGKSRLETAASLGIKFQVTPDIGLEDGISAVRLAFPRYWFDAERCQAGLEALMAYRRDYNTRLNEFKATPVHDWASHCADAFRGSAVRMKPIVDKPAGPRVPFTGRQGVSGWMG